MSWAGSREPPSRRPKLGVGKRAGGPSGEDSREDRPQRSAHAVDPEGVQAVVVAELAFTAVQAK